MNYAWEEKLEARIREYLDGYPACHDYFHLKRVRDNSVFLAKDHDCDLESLVAAAWLHDIGYKGYEDDDKNHYLHSMDIAEEWLPKSGFPNEKIAGVLEIIKLHDVFAWGYDGSKTDHLETKILQDADSLDMIGAIGIVRHAYYFGEKEYPIYSEEPLPGDDEKTIWLNHSLLDQLKRDTLKKWDRLNLESSRKIAQKRHQLMQDFYKELEEELTKGLIMI